MNTKFQEVNGTIGRTSDSAERNLVRKDKDAKKETINLKGNQENKDFEESSMAFSQEDLTMTWRELLANILNQVEYIFSNDNIWMDRSLLKQIFSNQDGYVSTKYIASLDKVKNLAKDWRIVALSLKNSKKLELSMDKTKVRRIQPLTDVGYPAQSGAVMIFGEFPTGIKTSNDVKELLGHFGSVTQAWLMESYAQVLNPIIMSSLAFYSEISSTMFAVAKYKTVEDSIQAIKIVINSKQKFIVVPLLTGKTSSLPSYIEVPESEDVLESSGDENGSKRQASLGSQIFFEDPKSKSEHTNFSKSRNTSKECQSEKVNPSSEDKHDFKTPSPINTESNKSKREGPTIEKIIEDSLVCLETKNASKTPPNLEFKTIRKSKLDSIKACSTSDDCEPTISKTNSPTNNPWKLKRQQSGQCDQKKVSVLRQPRGPDGTIGFHEGRAKMGLKSHKRANLKK